MFLWAFICTWPVIAVLLLFCQIARRRKALYHGLRVGSWIFWISLCLFCQVPIGQGVRDMRQEGSEEYYLMRALGFVPCSSSSALVLWNIIVFAAWLALLAGVTAYWHKRSAL